MMTARRGHPDRVGKAVRVFGIVLAVLVAGGAVAGDWPQWRHDASNSGVTPETLPAALHVQWVRELPPPRRAWPATQSDIDFDVSYEPVVLGKTLLVPSMVCDSVTAYDTDSGAEKWRFYADGPVRFAPVAGRGRVWFASDDGCVYCLNAGDGSLLWKVRGGPADRPIIGNDRLISTWPVRGAPALYDGKLYFAAGIWPFMGIFVCAIDAQTGKALWTNSGTGAMYIRQPHGSPAFAGVAPQGYVAVTTDKIIVPGGRTAPAVFERAAGKLLYYYLLRSKSSGYDITVNEANNVFDIRGHVHSLKSGYCCDGPGCKTMDYCIAGVLYYLDHRNKIRATSLSSRKFMWEATLKDTPKKIFIKAGNRLYCSDKAGTIMAIDLGKKTAAISWRGKVEGVTWNMLAADGKLFVVTEGGRIYCFGGERKTPIVYPLEAEVRGPTPAAWASRAREALGLCAAREGYCLALGIGSGGLIEAVIGQSGLRVVAVDPDAQRVAAFRRRMDAAGLYGRRVVARVGDPFAFPFPLYMANLVVSENPREAGFSTKTAKAERLFRPLRPYGGIACLSTGRADAVREWLERAGLENAQVSSSARFVTVRRAGALARSADWTHQNADAANSLVSSDSRVRAPLGLLWFGGPSNDKVLSRHGHGPSPQVVDGRLFIEGPHMLRAVDVYTGRVLWERDFEDLGKFHDTTKHQAGAGETGGNYVSMPDGIYVIRPDSCVRLSPETGKTITKFSLPPLHGYAAPRWGFITVWEDLLIAAAVPLEIGYPAFPLYTVKEYEQIAIARKPPARPRGLAVKPLEEIEAVRPNADYASASGLLVAMNRYSGKVLWSRKARYAFRHNAITVARGKVFCMDKMSKRKMAYLARRGLDVSQKAVLYALDARTGGVVWQSDENVSGTWLAYSLEHDVLVQAGGGGSRDRPFDEARSGMAVYTGDTGKVVWKSDMRYGGPCMLHHDWIIHNGGAVGILTGEERKWTHPLTGKEELWRVARGYGCGTMIACEYLLTFRSSAAGFYDLETDSGTANLGGFKSGCTSNLIAANGVLNSPDYTRTCICNFQNQTSLAMIHDANVEVWTFTPRQWDGAPVRRVGINLGAPGDRMDYSGTLWLDFPSVGGKSPDIPVVVEGGTAGYFRHHSSVLRGGGLRWVAASGVTGAGRIRVTLSKEKTQPRPCTVRLTFAEPRLAAKAGDRVFDVSLQGRPVLKGFDIIRAAGGSRRAVVKEFGGVMISRDLDIVLGAERGETLLCGVEIVAEAGKGQAQ